MQKNEGEGNRTAAKEYNDATQRFVKSGKVEEAARKAEKDLESDTGAMSEAEKAGRKPAHGETEV
jgi:hypothetical protein